MVYLLLVVLYGVFFVPGQGGSLTAAIMGIFTCIYTIVILVFQILPDSKAMQKGDVKKG